MPFDVLIVGGGPAGLAAAIRLKQRCLEADKDLSVCLVDKGSEIGAHILSGNVFEPKALHELFPDMADPSSDSHWSKQLLEVQDSYATPVSDDQFMLLSEKGKFRIPNLFLPPQLNNHGNYVISLSQLCRWLAVKAEELGVEIYPGFAASEVLVNEGTGAVEGIATRDVGIDKSGKPKATFERGVELKARQTLFAEGARGSCSEWLIDHYKLREGKDKHPQTYGLGLKEVWQVPEEKFKPGLVLHTLGYPLQSGPLDKVYGGCFLYHQEPDLVLLGLVVGLNYANPYINPYKEFQRWKTHPEIRKHIEGGTCLSYGGRVLNEGGYHSIPELTFPGGALLGCGAGFLNNVKIKGSHTAIKSGMLAAEAAFDALTEEGSIQPVAETGELPSDEPPIQLTQYGEAIEKSWIRKELYEGRNAHEAFTRWGIGGGMIYTGLTAHITKGREPWTLKHTGNDCETTGKAEDFKPIDYPASDGVLTFDLLTNLQRSGTYHEDDQPSHLRIKPSLEDVPKNVSMQVYGAPESRFCPAGVYEYVDNDEEGGPEKKLVINAQNCIHCKCCSIKMPSEYIDWTVPEGGGGPQYQVM